MRFLADSWNSVEPEIVAKCFRKAGVGQHPENAEISNVSDEEADPEDDNEPDRWQLISNGQSYQSFSGWDDEPAVSGVMSVQDLVDERTGGGEEEKSSEDEDGKESADTDGLPSFQEAMRGYISTRYLMATDMKEEEMRVVLEFGKIQQETPQSSETGIHH